jgi:hypothetical protein
MTSTLVSFDAHAIYEFLDKDVLDVVSGGATNLSVFLYPTGANKACGTGIDAPCNNPLNNFCVAPNGVCGANAGCLGAELSTG